jgi:hypothetical protein
MGLKAVFEEIAAIDLKDGFIFQEIKVNELIHPHMECVTARKLS